MHEKSTITLIFLHHTFNSYYFLGLRRPVYFQYDLGQDESISRTVDALLRDWERIANLYALVHDFAEYYQQGEC
jgi:hypothetical protein